MAEAIDWLGRLTPSTHTATFSGISQDYDSLLIKGYCQADSNSTSDWSNNDCYVYLNGDTSGIYARGQMNCYGNISGMGTKYFSVNTNGTEIHFFGARKQYSGSNTNSWSNITMQIYNYTAGASPSDDKVKKAILQSSGSNNLSNDCFVVNSSQICDLAAAVTSIEIKNFNNWVSGTWFDLYGIKVG